MKELRLSLILKWFNMTKQGFKGEDYREITPYWCSRFLRSNNIKRSVKWWESYFIHYNIEEIKNAIKNNCKLHRITFIKFDTNTMTLGYPKNGDIERILKLEHKGIKIGYGKEEWGAEPNKLYFVIMHGNTLINQK